MTQNRYSEFKQQLDEHGFCVVPDILSNAQVSDVRARLLIAAEQSERDNVPTRGYPFDADRINRRVFHLFNLDPIFVELIEHDAALEFVHHVLGESFLISNFSANITAPGNQRMQLHADQGYVPPPWPAQALAVNVAWVLDDFTEENGGTRYVPESHRAGTGPEVGAAYDSIAIEAPAGSLLVMDGRLWHQTGTNETSDCERAALFAYYVARWIRPQINWNAALWPGVAAGLSPRFLDRLGFYTGNVETQVPVGTRAALQTPAEILALSNDTFALGTENTND